MRDAKSDDADMLLAEWRWLVPAKDTPLWVSAFGDWVLGAPDGSLWVLSTLEGDYKRVASNAAEYNALTKSPEWTENMFLAGWFPIAIGNGLVPGHDECLGWKLHPLVGGAFTVENLQVFSMRVARGLARSVARCCGGDPRARRARWPSQLAGGRWMTRSGPPSTYATALSLEPFSCARMGTAVESRTKVA